MIYSCAFSICIVLIVRSHIAFEIDARALCMWRKWCDAVSPNFFFVHCICCTAFFYSLTFAKANQIDLKPIARRSLFKAVDEFIALSCAIDRTQQKWKLTCLTTNYNQILPDTCTSRWNTHWARRSQQFIPTLFKTVSDRQPSILNSRTMQRKQAQ